MLSRVSHYGHLVSDMEKTLAMYRDNFGIRPVLVTTISTKVRSAMMPIGDMFIELLQPLDPDGPAARRLASHGEGLYHVCFLVDDVQAEVKALQSRGAKVLPGTNEADTVFLAPHSTGGVLMEMWTPDSRDRFMKRLNEI